MSSLFVDTNKLRGHAERLSCVNARIKKLDRQLDALYLKVGLSGLLEIIQADELTGFNWRIVQCQNYLLQTASEFERLEKAINYNEYLSKKSHIALSPITSIGFFRLRQTVNSTDFFAQGIGDKWNEYLEIFKNDGDTRSKSKDVIKWLSSIRKDASKYKDYIEWIGGDEISWPYPIESGFDFIKALDTSNKLIFGALEYGEGIVNGDLESMTSGADNLYSALKAGISTALKNGDSMFEFKSGILLDYGKNMVSNWLESIQTETQVSEVYWHTFANSAVEVFNDTVCNTPTLAIAYKPAELISSVFGFDLQGAYENVSDKKGFAAVTDAFSQMNDLFMENSTWENWKSGMGVIVDGIRGWFK